VGLTGVFIAMVLDGRAYWNRVVLILGLIATGWFVWINSIGPRIGRAPLDMVLGRATGQILLAGLCGAAIAICVYLTVSWTGRGRVRHPLRSTSVAAWYFPAMILILAFSPVAVATGGVLVFATTRVMVARWDRSRPALRAFIGAPLLKRLAVALVCSVAIHMSVGAYARGSTVLAAVLFAGIIATLTSLAMVVGAYAPENPRRLYHSALGLLLILIMIVGVTINHRGGNGYGGGEDGGGSGLVTDNSFPGVILLRELEKNAVLIAPNLKRDDGAKGSDLFNSKPATLTQPMDVTFSGEYWMLLPWYRRPPPTSLIRRGNPAKLSFSTNGGPMVMEAHQLLRAPIDPASCDRIQIVVLGPDAQNMLVFQLFLVDGETPGPRGEESLGFQFVKGDPSVDGRETLSFSVPLATRLRSFNEIKLVFRQPRAMNKSVKIEVVRMTIVPR